MILERKPIIILFLIMPTLSLHAQDLTPINILIPTFQSPQGKSDIGTKTASILGLQIWRTYSTPTVTRSSFDNANIIFNSRSRPSTYAQAETIARRQTKNPHLVLWGKASEYGDGIVVESNLLIRKGNGGVGTNIWSVTIPTSKSSYTVSVDVPELHYEFAPIVLDPHLVLKLAPGLFRRSIQIYQMKSTASEVIGNLADSSIQAIRHEGNWSEVRVNNINQVGWLYLPNLSQNPSEVVNFCGGIIRVLRKDWRGAVSIFDEVLKTSNLPTAIKVDSYLYMAIAYDRMQEEAKSFAMVAEAYKLNPYSKTTTKYLYMSYLAHLSRVLPRSTHGEEAKKIIQSIQDLLSKNRVLFAEDDGWVRQVERILAELTRPLDVRTSNRVSRGVLAVSAGAQLLSIKN